MLSALYREVPLYSVARIAFIALTSGPRSKIFRLVENREMTEVEAASVLLRGRVCED